MQGKASICALLMVLGLPAQASPDLHRLNSARDSRGWEAVGRLELDGKGFCTAALVSDRQVLTAAHCLWDRETGERLSPTQIEFRAGLRHGRAAATRRIAHAVVHPDFDITTQDGPEQVRYDLALLELESPIRLSSVRPYPIGPRAGRGTEVGVVSYAHDRADAPRLQKLCHVLADRDGVTVLSCDVDFGSSGAPVFVLQGTQAHIVSIVAAKAEMKGRKVALGSDMQGAIATLRMRLQHEVETAP